MGSGGLHQLGIAGLGEEINFDYNVMHASEIVYAVAAFVHISLLTKWCVRVMGKTHINGCI